MDKWTVDTYILDGNMEVEMNESTGWMNVWMEL